MARALIRGPLKSVDVKNGSLLAKDFKAGQLPAGAQGPRGPAGPQGPAGAQGEKGATGAFSAIVTRTSPAAELPIADGSFVSAMVGCASGEKLIGGGGRVNAYDKTVHLLESRPAKADPSTEPPDEGTAPVRWRVTVMREQAGVDVADIYAYAICAS